MPPRRLFSWKRHTVQSPSLPPNDSSPNRVSTSIIQRTHPDPPTAPQRVYLDYLNETAGPGWDAALTVASIVNDIPAVPLALVPPLTQVLEVVSEISDAVKKMRDANDECRHLIFRVLKFLQYLVDVLKGRNIPDSAPTADSLRRLKRDLLEIHTDATRWSRLNVMKLYLRRDKIMTAISRHGENLTDCLRAFQIAISIPTFNPMDRVETARFLSPSVPATPVAAPENTPASIFAAGIRNFFECPASQAIFEPIVTALQGHLEGMKLPATAPPPGSNLPDTTILRTGHNRHVSFLTRQISELTTEVGVILPDISVATDIKAQFVGCGTHRAQTGNPTQQLHETVLVALQLLKELHGTPEIELDSAILPKKMNKLGLSLRDLGLWDEAVQVQTKVVELLRVGGDPSDVAFSLNNLSACLWDLHRHEEGLKACQEAVGIFRPLVSERREVLAPDFSRSLCNLSGYLFRIGPLSRSA
ncbi:hypothetical protein BS47DRAFT_321154 [Hydnum rufescens UP504]|uniref:Uncharacterized protein n=1 Tax=Hydnum rufescens UP504 TaxID=1448309 RepID=A0A9P6DLU8_9AGAM|nr:hypothetical protein BS47DRAFT_321154 [Hydnum rufescens UP504]